MAKAKRFKGRYTRDDNYFYVEKPPVDGVAEIVRVPHKELDVIEIIPNSKREIRYKRKRKHYGLFTLRELVMLILGLSMPIFGLLWATDMLRTEVVFIGYWIITFVLEGFILYANWEVWK